MNGIFLGITIHKLNEIFSETNYVMIQRTFRILKLLLYLYSIKTSERISELVENIFSSEISSTIISTLKIDVKMYSKIASNHNCLPDGWYHCPSIG